MIGAYLKRHAQALIGSAGELARAPAATFMTVAVIGITLAFPAGLYLLVHNLKQLSGGWDQGRQISLFLKSGVSPRAAESLAERIRRLPGVEHVAYVSPAQGLAEFKRTSGFGESLNALETNPLPAVLVLRPAAALDPAAVQALWKRLQAETEVDLAQLDLRWVQRLQALLALVERGVLLLAVLLGLAVMLIVGNTIRLAVANRRTEIEVIALVGGTPAFIRRPFVYAGALQGLLGGLAAWAVVSLALFLLAGPLDELSGLYGSHWTWAGHGVGPGLALTLTGVLLGYAGSRFAVARHIKNVL